MNQPQLRQMTLSPQFPQVTVFIDPNNPNLVQVASNQPELLVFKLLAAGIDSFANHLIAKAQGQLASNIVMPDGSAAPMPVKEEMTNGQHP